MTDRELLDRAVLAHPDEDTPRLALADWLDEHGTSREDGARATFIRAQIDLHNGTAPECGRRWGGSRTSAGLREPARNCRCKECELIRRERAACRGFVRKWERAAIEPVTTRRPNNDPGINYAWPFVWFRRGFPESLWIDAEDFMRHAGALLSRSPVTEVRLVAAVPEGALGHPWDSRRPHGFFMWACGHSDPPWTGYRLPPTVFDLLPDGQVVPGERHLKTYPCRGSALDALDRACLLHGRRERDRIWANVTQGVRA